MADTSEFLKRAAQRTGLKREFFLEKNIPTEPSNVLAVPFFGDLRSTAILSTFLLPRIKEIHPNKYVVLCSWPGFNGLFPYVDEYWSLTDNSGLTTLASEANSFYNTSNLATELTRGLFEVLNIQTSKDFLLWYNKGFSQKYWEDFKTIQRFRPEVLSSSVIPADLRSQLEKRRGRKVVVFPTKKMRSWQQGRTINMPAQKDFWVSLIERLLEEGFEPVIHQNWFTYDMSPDFTDRCMYLVTKSVAETLAAFRTIGCVLDIHSGISRLAQAARCPYVVVTERASYIEDKDHELDDLCGLDVPKQYVFSFSTMLMTGTAGEWKVSLLDELMVRLNQFVSNIDLTKLPSTSQEFEPVSYDVVRTRTARRAGMRFIKTSKQK